MSQNNNNTSKNAQETPQQNTQEEQPKRNPIVQLALNGKPIYLHNMLVSVSVRREEKDMSGQKSSTKKSDKGVKAKEMTVSGIIPYSRKEWLTDLFNLAESEDGKGEQTKYRVSSVSAQAVNMREVQFSDEISAHESSDRLAWEVNFKLKEVNSVAEKKDQRKKKPKTKVQGEKAPVTKADESNKTAQPVTQQANQENDKPQDKRSGWAKELDDLLG